MGYFRGLLTLTCIRLSCPAPPPPARFVLFSPFGLQRDNPTGSKSYPARPREKCVAACSRAWPIFRDGESLRTVSSVWKHVVAILFLRLPWESTPKKPDVQPDLITPSLLYSNTFGTPAVLLSFCRLHVYKLVVSHLKENLSRSGICHTIDPANFLNV